MNEIESQAPGDWSEVFTVLDQAKFPEDFLEDRNQGIAETRDESAETWDES